MSTIGHLNCSESAAIVIQRWFRIRKKKTLFEFLSIYSFSKRLELVSLCQQVHMYNQEFNFQLQKNRVINNIDHEIEEIAEQIDISKPLDVETIRNQETIETEIEHDNEDHNSSSSYDSELNSDADFGSFCDAEQHDNDILEPKKTPIKSSDEKLPSTSNAGVGLLGELTMRATLAKNISRKHPDTDAPYNFQALLRKTKYSDRKSLRRVQDMCSKSSDGIASPNKEFTIIEPHLLNLISRHEIMPGFAVIGQCAEW